MRELGNEPDRREPRPSELGRVSNAMENRAGMAAFGSIEPRIVGRVKTLAVALVLIAVVVCYGLLSRDGITRAQNQAPPNPAAAPEKPPTPLAAQPAQPAQQAQQAQPAPEKDTSDHPMAPGFSLKGLDGKKLDLADYKGKVVLIDFWATWCGPCRVEIPGLVEMQDRHASEGFSVIGISMDDDPAAVPEFFKQFRMNYPVAVGDARISELYGGVYGLPTAFIIGRDGRIYAKFEGAFPVAVFDRAVQQLLAVKATDVPTGFNQKIDLGDPDEINSEVPGVNLTKLSAEQKEEYKKQLEKGLCTCGCNRNLLDCRLNDRGCGVSLKAAKEQLDKFLRKSAI
ncbi:MAG TPA: TlpA disulfide reductase family protein [Terriglobia bacterium]|nr:TlpA disulfide reductase family protein [Terriglobia bacterium]